AIISRPHIAITMATFLKGPTPFALILCAFNDIPPLNIPKASFVNLISQLGHNGLCDFWHDVSYGQIDLTSSEVFGWYTMKYSFAHDSRDPLHNTDPMRGAWIAEGIRLANADGVDLSPFHSVIVIIN